MKQFQSASREAVADRAAATVLTKQTDSGQRTAVTRPEGAAPLGRGEGARLPEGERQRLEPGFGHDFSAVRIHADGSASAAAAAVGARALTYGTDIAFAPGEWNPGSRQGRALLAHELAHVSQQARDGQPRVEAKGKDEKTPDQEIDEELPKSALDPKALDPQHPDYAGTLGQYGWGLTRDKDSDVVAEPRDKGEKAAWKRRFEKADRVARRILDQSGPKVTDKDSRASTIAADLATAGFVDKAMALALQMQDKNAQGLVYAAALDRPDKMSAENFATIAKFTVGRGDKLGDNPIIAKLTADKAAFSKQLGAAKLSAGLGELVPAYAGEGDFPGELAKLAFLDPGSRSTITQLLLEQKRGALLEAVSSQPYFAEGARITLADNSETSPSGKDLAWAVANRQRVVVDDIVALGEAAGVKIKAPVKQDIKTLRAWLEANTENIGAAIAKLHPGDMATATALLTRIEQAFMYHVDPDTPDDIKADPHGRIGGLKAGGPALASQLEVDCDVLAAYGVRTLVASGYTPVGYMAIVPKDAGRANHAMAMVEKAGKYLLLSNMSSDLSDATTKDEALEALRDFGISEAYDANRKLSGYDIYYEDSDARGTMPKAVSNLAADAKIDRLGK